ncbi:MAG: peptidylprolyl isomerase [Planctomycetes bacterium]|nr:peptidylprolyl isomerase [Planctomycetota bacterium]
MSDESTCPPRHRIRVDTTEGAFIIELRPDIAPRTAENFQQLVHNGFYDGLTFHRVIPDFIVQAGCPHGDGTGGPGYTVNAEFNDLPHEKGTVSMARTNNPDSAGSQFFICLSRDNCQHLDGQYTAFGKVIEGIDIIDRLAAVPLIYPELGTPMDPPMILHCTEEWNEQTSA